MKGLFRKINMIVIMICLVLSMISVITYGTNEDDPPQWTTSALSKINL